jgi:hypothetical protein
MRTDYVIRVSYQHLGKPVLYDYRSAWTAARVKAFFRAKHRYAAAVTVTVAPPRPPQPVEPLPSGFEWAWNSEQQAWRKSRLYF